MWQSNTTCVRACRDSTCEVVLDPQSQSSKGYENHSLLQASIDCIQWLDSFRTGIS